MKHTTVVEEQSICDAEDDMTSPLLHLLVSSHLARQAQSQGIPIHYQGCPRKESNSNVQHQLSVSIQLSLNNRNDDDDLWMTREELVGICRDTLQVTTRESTSTASWVPFFLHETNGKLRNHLLLLLNMHWSAVAPRAPRVSVQGPSDETTAVLVLSCRDTQCSDALVTPHHVYLEHLPSSVQSIDVLLSPQCIHEIPRCQQYGQELITTLQQFFPRATVNLLVHPATSMEVAVRLMGTQHVVCGPGDGGRTTCLLPCLARLAATQRDTATPLARFTMVGDSTTASILSKTEVPHMLPYLNLLLQGPQLPITSLSSLGQLDDIIAFARSSPESGQSGICRRLRGRVGAWVQDFQYAAAAQYRGALAHSSFKAESLFREKVQRGESPGGLLYRPSTTYKWSESFYPTCGMDLVSRDGMCQLLRSMDVRRIFLLGDSLMEQQGLALWRMISTEPDDPARKSSGWRHVIDCGSDFSFVLQFIKNDELLETAAPVDVDVRQKNCHNYCYPWTQEYTSDPSKTIMLVNTGAHLHEPPLFRAAIDRFIHTLDRLNRPEDIVLFRTLVPGHKGCGRPGLQPFHNFQQYVNDIKGQTTKLTYNWNMFAAYNDYVASFLDRRISHPEKARIELLDVFPMTVLRPDGHVADEFRAPGTKIMDCLHYSMPGPIDWWNHMAYNHLIDIAKDRL